MMYDILYVPTPLRHDTVRILHCLEKSPLRCSLTSVLAPDRPSTTVHCLLVIFSYIEQSRHARLIAPTAASAVPLNTSVRQCRRRESLPPRLAER